MKKTNERTLYGMTYEECRAWIMRGRNGYDRPIQCNTRLRTYTYNGEPAVAVVLHGHAIVLLSPDGRVRLKACGWRTRTTLDRINTALAAWGTKYGVARAITVYSERGCWRVRTEYRTAARTFNTYEYDRETRTSKAVERTMVCAAYVVDFFENIAFDRRGRCLNGPTPSQLQRWRERDARARRRRLAAAAKARREQRRRLIWHATKRTRPLPWTRREARQIAAAVSWRYPGAARDLLDFAEDRRGDIVLRPVKEPWRQKLIAQAIHRAVYGPDTMRGAMA